MTGVVMACVTDARPGISPSSRGNERGGPMTLRQADGPPLRHYLSEPSRAAADLGKYLAARPLVMPRLPQGDGHPVLVLPGLLADDVSTGLLRGRLRRLGYRAHGWKLGRNIGPTARCVQGLEDRMTELADRY